MWKLFLYCLYYQYIHNINATVFYRALLDPSWVSACLLPANWKILICNTAILFQNYYTKSQLNLSRHQLLYLNETLFTFSFLLSRSYDIMTVIQKNVKKMRTWKMHWKGNWKLPIKFKTNTKCEVLILPNEMKTDNRNPKKILNSSICPLIWFTS